MVLAMFDSICGSSYHKGQEHVVTLRWNPARPTGLDLSVGDGFAVRVKSVDQSGTIGDWNRAHPSAQVKSGDIIVKVNGISGGSLAMLRELKSSRSPILQLRVRHIP